MTPPRHSIAHPMRILDTHQDYWDNERAAQELEDTEDPDEIAAHPVVAYQRADHLFDLDAMGAVFPDGEREEHSVREYLLGKPPAFICRRLKAREVAGCIQLGDESGAVHAFVLACKGLEDVEGFTLTVPLRKMVSDGQLEAIQGRLGYDVIARIGKMIVAGSRKPTYAEKKVLDS